MTDTTSPTTSATARIVVGVDGSAGSNAALRWAARLAPTLGAEIHAVTCWAYPVSYGMSGAAGVWNPEQDAKTSQETALAAAFPDAEPAGLQRIVREGHPAQVLLDLSIDADMLVVGSRGHGGFVGLLIGSVSAHCAEHAPCPVLVIHDN